MKPTAAVLAVIALIVGVLGIAYARWTRAIAEADQALAANDYPRALTAYGEAQARFDGVPAARQLFAAEYNRVVANELWLLYRLEKYDEAIDRAERAPDAASPHFWSGVAFFEKASAEEKPDARLGWLTRAEEELHKAVEAAPEDWDTKFDFELTTRLAAELRKQPKTPPKQLMQLLRPPQPAGKPTRRVG